MVPPIPSAANDQAPGLRGCIAHAQRRKSRALREEAANGFAPGFWSADRMLPKRR